VTWDGQMARLQAGIDEQEARAAERPERMAILAAIRDAFNGEEPSVLDFDTNLPENIAAYRIALNDALAELGCDGRVTRAAAVILACRRLGKGV
jgi:hypothetical protein